MGSRGWDTWNNGGGGGGGGAPGLHCIHMRGLPFKASEDDIADVSK